MNTTHRLLPFLLVLPCALLAMGPLRAAENLTFEQHVRPILKTWCLDCHGASEKLRGKLDLRLRRFIVKGGTTGPAIVPGNAAKSRLLQRLKSGEMPPTEKKVPAQQIALIEQWIAGGAIARHDEPDKLPPGIHITPEERASWFFQPLGKARPPVITSDRIRTPVDAFILAKLRERGLSFNPDADRLTLLRRVSLDLLGLPPTPEEVDLYLADRSADAYEKMLDRLLASPAYGERWGRHWLDPAGYADSDGDGTRDTPRPHAWKYRDVVVRSLNADKPLDRFIIEQLAGDELVPRPWNNLKAEQIEILTATGFLRMAPDGTSSGGGAADSQQVVADTLKIVSSTLLGLSVGCAQCHDHRYDPIPQADYYRLRAVFEPALNPANWRAPAQRRLSLYTDADRAKSRAIDAAVGKMQAEFVARQQKYVRAAFEKELSRFPAEQRDKLRTAFDTPPNKRSADQNNLVASNPKLNVTPGVLYQYNQPAANELKGMQAKINAKRAEKPIEDFIALLDEVPGQIPATRVFHRGDYRQPKTGVLPGDLTIAAPEGKRFEIPAKDPRLSTSGRRLAFARHLTDGSHPLLGRVLANRIWMHHMGRGIVDTPGDFGVLGQKPTHPELLDFLACELVRRNWSLKSLHRLLMTSTVYRQSSRRDRTIDDSGNALYGRFLVRRLDAEVLRDRILATVGRLDRTLFGPPVPIVEDTTGQVGVPDDKPRRSLYVQVRRSKPVAFLSTFDTPSGELNCDKRIATTAAPQALMLMNSEFVRQQADHFARRLLQRPAVPMSKRINRAWQLAYQRLASHEELELACQFVERQTLQLRGAFGQGAQRAALTNLCQQLLASNEFLYVD